MTLFFFPGHQPGHFNLLAWQLLYVLGFVLGSLTPRHTLTRFLTSKPLLCVLGLCALGLCLSRHTLLVPEITEGIDRASLGWLRVVNCLLLIALVSAWLQRLPVHRQVPWLALLGQHPLPVFAFHVVMLYLFTPLTQSIVATYGSTGLLGLMILEVYGLRLPALLHRKYTPWGGRIGTGVSFLLRRAAFSDVR